MALDPFLIRHSMFAKKSNWVGYSFPDYKMIQLPILNCQDFYFGGCLLNILEYTNMLSHFRTPGSRSILGNLRPRV